VITGTDSAPMALAPAEPDASMAIFRKIEPEWLLLFHLAAMPLVTRANIDVCGAVGCMIIFSKSGYFYLFEGALGSDPILFL